MSSNSVDLNAETVESPDEARTVPLEDETVATPHHLTLYYVSEKTPEQLSNKFPQEKLCKHPGETILIERSEVADILLNAKEMPRSFVELWCHFERECGPKWYIKNKHGTKTVEICDDRSSVSLNQYQEVEVRKGSRIKLDRQLTFTVFTLDGDALNGDFEVEVLPDKGAQRKLTNHAHRQISCSSTDSSGSSSSGVPPYIGVPVQPRPRPDVIHQPPYHQIPHPYSPCIPCIYSHPYGQTHILPIAFPFARSGANFSCSIDAGAEAANIQGQILVPYALSTQAASNPNHFQPSLPPGIPVCDSIPTGHPEIRAEVAHTTATFNCPQNFQDHQHPHLQHQRQQLQQQQRQQQQFFQPVSHGDTLFPSYHIENIAVGPLHGPTSLPINNSVGPVRAVGVESSTHASQQSHNLQGCSYPIPPESAGISPHRHQQEQHVLQPQRQNVVNLQPSILMPSDSQRGVAYEQVTTTNTLVTSSQPVQVASSTVDSLSGIHYVSPRQTVSEGLPVVGPAANHYQLSTENMSFDSSARPTGTEESQQQVQVHVGQGQIPLGFVGLSPQQMLQGQISQTQASGGNQSYQGETNSSMQRGQNSPGAIPASISSISLHQRPTEDVISSSLLTAAANGNAINLRATGVRADETEFSDFSSTSSENVLDLQASNDLRRRQPEEDDERHPQEHDDQ
ncbi:uncharacterized protein LOC112576438 [Pomacea canaliculata]|uniref:uncharacterized protein LOC112576438 n=1 Tax=Pomacea canaliculata TaxID=400727 RepID=UPI000D727703|nr:uncharacterized protein LOC112576438 [Pomacea canaliculata]XP_025114633.1 uncharacterized protein LOC112576438 [Pomacea canaliculata]